MQGVYSFDMAAPAIQVDTFCVHGGPDGYITGIRGKVQCLSEEDLEKQETDLEKREMIKEKCYLRFPTIPFIPKEPYDVIATDYDNFALVSGAKDKSFVQVKKAKLSVHFGFHNLHQKLWSSTLLFLGVCFIVSVWFLDSNFTFSCFINIILGSQIVAQYQFSN